MKRRHSYLLLFAVTAFLAAALICFMIFGAIAGALWLFVYGDNPWPSWNETVLVTVAVAIFLLTWASLLYASYSLGKARETSGSDGASPATAAVGGTLLLLALAIAYQWHVGNLGPKSPGELCSAFCHDKGFAGSGLPPRNEGASTCSCYDPQGREALKVPIGEVRAEVAGSVK
jgi:hypothetical protein